MRTTRSNTLVPSADAVADAAQITLAYAVGSLVKGTGNFNLVMIFVASHALLAIIAYAFIVGPIKRLELKEKPPDPAFPVLMP